MELTRAGHLNPVDLLLGRQVGGLGSTCGLALALGGIYLILRGIIRWEISVAFIAGLTECEPTRANSIV